MNIGHFLAKKLQEEGCRLAAFTIKKTTHEFITEQEEVKYDNITSMDKIMENPKGYLAGDDYPLEYICAELGVDSIWPFVYSLRNHVKSYKDKYYFGFKQNIPDEGLIDYIKAAYKYVKFIFEKFGPEAIISPNIIALPHIIMNLYAEKRGVKMIAVTDSKVVGYYFFSYNFNDSKGAFHNRIEELNSKMFESENKQRAKKYIREFRDSFIRQECSASWDLGEKKESLFTRIKRELYPYKRILRWYIKGPSKNYIKSIGISIDYIPPKYILRDHYARKRYKKFMENYKYFDFDKLKKFVYFPMQVQPEATIDVQAPYFNNQIETMRQIAISLPDDYVLVAREHPGMVGLRPPSYLEKVARTPNVKLIDYRIPNEKVMKSADLVISPNSTTLAEAAFYNKPAIQFGNLGTTLRLPNVEKNTDMSLLSKKIKEMLNKNLKTEEYERRLENFVAAVYDIGFDFKYATFWTKGKGDDKEVLWQTYKNELERVFCSAQNIK